MCVVRCASSVNTSLRICSLCVVCLQTTDNIKDSLIYHSIYTRNQTKFMEGCCVPRSQTMLFGGASTSSSCHQNRSFHVSPPHIRIDSLSCYVRGACEAHDSFRVTHISNCMMFTKSIYKFVHTNINARVHRMVPIIISGREQGTNIQTQRIQRRTQSRTSTPHTNPERRGRERDNANAWCCCAPVLCLVGWWNGWMCFPLFALRVLLFESRQSD